MVDVDEGAHPFSVLLRARDVDGSEAIELDEREGPGINPCAYGEGME